VRISYILGNLFLGNDDFVESGPFLSNDVRVELPKDYHVNAGYHADFWSVMSEYAHGFQGNSVRGGAEYRAGQVTVGIVKSADVGLEFAPNPAGFALRVPDVDAACEELAGAGVELTEVYDTGVCRLAFFSDPDGNRLVLHRRYAP